MTSTEEFVARARALISSAREILSESDYRDIMHLIDHNEVAEAMRSLAWTVVEERKRIPRHVYLGIRELSAGLVDEAEMPRDLEAFVVERS